MRLLKSDCLMSQRRLTVTFKQPRTASLYLISLPLTHKVESKAEALEAKRGTLLISEIQGYDFYWQSY